MSRQDLPRNKVHELGATIVHVVNLSDFPFKAESGGQLYILPPKSKRPVLRQIAEHWLGDPLATDFSISGNTWALEMVRLQNLYGVPDHTATKVKPKINQFELVQSGKVFCPEFGAPHISKLQNMTPAVRTALMGVPMEQDEIAAASGAEALTGTEFSQFKAETEDAILKVQEMSSPEYVGYGVDDTILQAMVKDLS